MSDTALLLDLLDSSSDDDSDIECEMQIAVAHSKRRKIWIEPHIKKRKTCGEFNLYDDLSTKKFQEYFRESRETFISIHDLIKQDIKKQNTNMRQSISTEERLSVCLR